MAAVRQSKGSEPRSNVPLGPGNVYPSSHGILSAKDFPLLTYILFAYKLADYQVAAIKSSAPEWVLNDRFNIEARNRQDRCHKERTASDDADAFGRAVQAGRS